MGIYDKVSWYGYSQNSFLEAIRLIRKTTGKRNSVKFVIALTALVCVMLAAGAVFAAPKQLTLATGGTA